jgi:hypothetical protein
LAWSGFHLGLECLSADGFVLFDGLLGECLVDACLAPVAVGVGRLAGLVTVGALDHLLLGGRLSRGWVRDSWAGW